MSRILLIQVDGKMPNLALMKISSYYKSLGDSVGFDITNPDKVYSSCIFSDNLSDAMKGRVDYPLAEFYIGGPGLLAPTYLPDEVEHIMPDYSLYPDIDFSLGFTSRGCINDCGFCVVPKIEGCYKENAPIKEFHNPEFEKLILLDNNILAGKKDKIREKFDYILENDLKVSFTQGLDARLIDETVAVWLAELRSYNFHFTRKGYYLAWDFVQNENDIITGIQNLINVGEKPYKMMCYVLVGYNTTHQEDYYRFKKLREISAEPFIMVYNNRKDDKWIRHFARWVNRRYYKSCSLNDYLDKLNYVNELGELFE